MSGPDDSFVSRWSRLKRRPRAPQDAPGPELDVPAVESQVSEPKVDPGAQEPAAADPDELVKNLPDIETMTEESDFTAFLQEGVPEDLRNRALRHLWRLNPVFANVDGLNDYDLDYTDAAVAVKGVLKTLHQVGKGMPRPEPVEEADIADAAASEGSSDDRSVGDEDQEATTGEPPDESDNGNANGPRGEGEAEAPAQDPAVLADMSAESVPPTPVRSGTQDRPAAGVAAAPTESGNAARRRWARFTT